MCAFVRGLTLQAKPQAPGRLAASRVPAVAAEAVEAAIHRILKMMEMIDSYVSLLM